MSLEKEIRYIKECILYSVLIRRQSFYLDESIGSDFYRLKKEDYTRDQIFSLVYQATNHLKNIKILDVIVENYSTESNSVIEIIFLYKNKSYRVEVN